MQDVKSVWDTLLPVLVGAGIGGLGSVFILILKDAIDAARARQSLASSLAGEISGLCEIARRRRYLQGLKLRQEHLIKSGIVVSMKLQITASYFVVFDANAIRLGSIGPQLSEDVAHFYLLVKSLVEDAKQGPSEPIDKAIGEYMLREQIELLEHVLQLGGQLKERLKADANRGFMSKP